MTSTLAHLYKETAKNHQHIKGLELIEFADMQQHHSILDIGCGTGELTYILASKVHPWGKVYGIDPDHSRIEVAQRYDIHNAHVAFEHTSIENYESATRFDLIYSNYVLHWVQNKEAVLTKIKKLLQPSGRFVMQCITGTPEILQDLKMLSTSFKESVMDTFPITSEEEWMHIIQKTGFKVNKKEAVNDFVFSSLEEFLQWWEATTHGMFHRGQLTEKHLHFLKKKYPGTIAIYGDQTIRISLS